ncbi:hypothetical protein [Chelativorans sp. AA-79]|uniref:hypothetical protein n=1 Tax=Chelativorans sp. AA-79 TaxID=3028735 RepID=UPI0023F7057C|nr:hypothetical protein [Chelativorans sp. AA-79]WEX09298.1 hypothetical protein PVE73_25305 [Chelativorans sp. AA-79]
MNEGEMQVDARKAGAPEGAIAVMLGYYRAAQAGEFTVVDRTLHKILDRALETMCLFLNRNLR